MSGGQGQIDDLEKQLVAKVQEGAKFPARMLLTEKIHPQQVAELDALARLVQLNEAANQQALEIASRVYTSARWSVLVVSGPPGHRP